MTHVLCQIVTYPPLEIEHEEPKVEEKNLSTDKIECSTIQHLNNDISSCDEYVDEMERVFID